MKNNFALAAALLLFLFSMNLSAQNDFDKSKLDDYLRLLETNNKAMLGLVITRDGKLAYENYIGFSSVEENMPNSKATKFRIGSITKMFTAAIIFLLIEENKLTLDTRLSEFYPQIPNAKEITISNLLSHTSGIYNFTNDKEYANYMTSKKSHEEMIKIIAELKPAFKPNKKTEYSNSNFVLLGYIIEKLTNSTYEQEIQKRITGTLGLADAYYGHKIETAQNEAASYRYQEEKWDMQPETDMSIPHGAGAIVSTPKNLAAFAAALFSDKLISASSLNHMKDIKDGVGKGLFRFPFGEKFAYGHGGGIDGFVSNLAYFPNENVALAITANGMNYNFNDILIGVLSIYFNVPFEMPDFSAKKITLSQKQLENYEGEFSSKSLPLIITLKVTDDQLFGQATGQAAFPLTPFSTTEFRFEQAGLLIEFAQDNSGEIQYDSFVLNQGGGKFPYERK